MIWYIFIATYISWGRNILMVERVGQQLGSYRLTDLLGQGGFANVYLGEHIYLQTKAAIKVLQAHLSGPDDMESFLREAKVIAHLTHPHIVRILDFGIDKETPFLVMDYAPNGTLRQRHPKRAQLQLPTIVSYVKQLADALQYSHDERLIHRDIKPENMLIGKRNEILLSDFGIALLTQSSRSQSIQGVVGTIPYMSPEHIQGRARPASDQYSLGIVVYEWLSGERPFSGTFVELCTQHLFAPVPSLRKKVPTILSEVEQVVLKALEKDPKQRFDNVQAFADALEQASQRAIRAVISLPQSRPSDALIPSLASVPFEKIPPNSDAFPPNLQTPSKGQKVIKTFAKDPKQCSDSANPSKQVSEPEPKVMVALSPSPSNGASVIPLAPTLFAEDSPASGAFSLNLQGSSRQQVVGRIAHDKGIRPKDADTTVSVIERAKKCGASLRERMPLNLEGHSDILERARKRGASLQQMAPRSVDAQSIGQRDIILMILGTAIFGILDYCADRLVVFNSILFTTSIDNLPYFPSYGDLLFFGLALAMILFLGARFGPWIGSISALVGSLSGDFLASYISPTQWGWYASIVLIGFISGLTYLKTYGRYNTKGAITIAVLISFFGILIGNLFLASVDSISNHLTINSFVAEFTTLILTNAIGSLAPLVVLLIINEKFISREKQKAHRA